MNADLANGGVVLSVRDLRVSFAAVDGEITAVDGVGFDLRAGESVGLVGETGCGKSVTGRALMGLLSTQQARIETTSLRLHGQDIGAFSERQWRRIRGSGIAMISQEPMTALDPVFRVGDQLERVIRRHRPDARRDPRREARRLLQEVGFASPELVLDSWPHQLSGGMRQRIMIAMATACRPAVLIADEPTTALDVTTQAYVLEQIDRLKGDFGTAVLLITHDLAIVAGHCRRAMVMYCGRIVEKADCDTLFRKPAHPYTAGLLASLPRLSKGEPDPVHPVPGQLPEPGSIPRGCAFSPRCTRADDLCRADRPGLKPRAGAEVACHHPLGEIS